MLEHAHNFYACFHHEQMLSILPRVQHFVEGAEQVSRKEGPEKRSADSIRQKLSFAYLRGDDEHRIA